MWTRAKGAGTISTNAQECVQPNSVTMVGVQNAYASVVALKRAGVLMSRSLKVDGIQMSLSGVAWSTCIENVGAWRMLGKCSTRFHLRMWLLGMPYLCHTWAGGRECDQGNAL